MTTSDGIVYLCVALVALAVAVYGWLHPADYQLYLQRKVWLRYLQRPSQRLTCKKYCKVREGGQEHVLLTLQRGDTVLRVHGLGATWFFLPHYFRCDSKLLGMLEVVMLVPLLLATLRLVCAVRELEQTAKDERSESQLHQWVLGKSIHNTIDDECCPDFSCCRPEMRADAETRKRYAAADRPEQELMRGRWKEEYDQGHQTKS